MYYVKQFRAILCIVLLSCFSLACAMDAEGEASLGGVSDFRQPLSLSIIYHQPMAKMGEVAIDNGAIAHDLINALQGNVSALLVSGCIAYPLLVSALAGYADAHEMALPYLMQKPASEIAQKCHFGGLTWDNLKVIGSNFLSAYNPYIVMVPQTGPAGSERCCSCERFVLFLRKDCAAEIRQAFNVNNLRPWNIGESDVLARGGELLMEVSQACARPESLARTIMGIFNQDQRTYSWNIAIMGHGKQMKFTDAPLLERADNDSQEGLIANMPPRQFGLLLRFFNTIPVNIVTLLTCFGGGYNASLIEPVLVGLRGRQFTFVSLAAFDSVTYLPFDCKTICELETFVSIQGRLGKEVIKRSLREILGIGCSNPAIVLMPTSDHFEMLSGVCCPHQLVWKLLGSDNPSSRSIALLDDFMRKQYDQKKYHIFEEFRAKLQKATGAQDENDWDVVLAHAVDHYRLPESLVLYATTTCSVKFLRRVLRRAGVTQNEKDEALERAVKQFDLGAVKELIDVGADPSVTLVDSEMSALFYTVKNGLVELARELLGSSKCCANQEEQFTTPLCLALENDMLDMLDVLLAHHGIDVNLRASGDVYPIFLAIERNNVKAVEKLISKSGIDLKVRNFFGETPLMVVVEENRPIIVDMLLNKGSVGINEKSRFGVTALMIAVRKNAPDMVERLLREKDIDVHVANMGDDTALTEAIRVGSECIVDQLLRKGATVADLDLCLARGKPEIARMLKDAGVASLER